MTMLLNRLMCLIMKLNQGDKYSADIWLSGQGRYLEIRVYDLSWEGGDDEDVEGVSVFSTTVFFDQAKRDRKLERCCESLAEIVEDADSGN